MIFMPSWYDGVAMLVARVLVGGYFIYAGVTQLLGATAFTSYLASLSLPAPSVLVWLVIAIHIIPGAMLLVGYQTKLAALMLAVFTFLTIPVAHADWTQQTQMMFALKNVAIGAGLLYMSVHGSGAWSIDEKKALPPMVI